MTIREWLPSEWLDEITPQQGSSPDVFLWRNPAGVLMLAPCDEAERKDAIADNFYIRPIEQGEEIDFSWSEDRGWRTVSIRADRSWAVDEPFAADTTHVWDSDTGILGDGLDDFMQSLLLDLDPALLPTDITVHGYVWGEGGLFRVVVAENGDARFEPVAAKAEDERN